MHSNVIFVDTTCIHGKGVPLEIALVTNARGEGILPRSAGRTMQPPVPPKSWLLRIIPQFLKNLPIIPQFLMNHIAVTVLHQNPLYPLLGRLMLFFGPYAPRHQILAWIILLLSPCKMLWSTIRKSWQPLTLPVAPASFTQHVLKTSIWL